MTSYALRRLIIAAPTLFMIVTLSFFMMHLAPGGPFDAEASLEPEVIANLEAAYDLDKPIIVQYGFYLGKVARGDFGPSIVYIDRTVTELLTIGLPISLRLGLSAMILALAVGGSLGVIAALRRNSSTDYAVMGVAMTGIAVPSFVMAPLMSLLFGVVLKILPVASLEPRGGLAEALPMLAPITPYILPVVALALPQIAILARLTRGAMIETLRQNYIRTARAKGLGQRNVVWTHALKSASLPVISYLGPAAASILTGSVVIEQIFQLPGMGRFFIQGAINRDYPLVLGIVVVYALAVILLNLIVDLMYGLLDPKVKVE